MKTTSTTNVSAADPSDATDRAFTPVRFSIGYRLPDENGSFPELVREFGEHVSEVYFAWNDMPSGRSPMSTRLGYTDWSAQEQLERDLGELRAMGVHLNLLFNANCYGKHAISLVLENQVRGVLDHLGEKIGGVAVVTTTSPAIAHVVRKHFPGIRVRASVNMRIGTIQGMGYVADLFDGFHVQRDFQRNLAWLREFAEQAGARGKSVVLLANSGCLRFCSGQTFHDNLVAHETEISETPGIRDWDPHVCWKWYGDRKNWASILQSTWIRPEDIARYAPLVSTVKLATRMHGRPRLVLRAYTTGRFRGNLLDLLEPGFSPVFAPWMIANDRFPDDWFEVTSQCDGRCHACTYCEEVLKRVLIDPIEIGLVRCRSPK